MKPIKPVEAWWPASLGESPNSAGGQNEMRYAYFAGKQRLAIETDGSVRIYDTEDHQISGVQQDQSGSARNIVFTSQQGEMNLNTLKRVQDAG